MYCAYKSTNSLGYLYSGFIDTSIVADNSMPIPNGRELMTRDNGDGSVIGGKAT